MLDTLAAAREMTAGGIDRDQAETIANAMRKVAEPGDHVTSDQFKAGLAEIRTEIAELRSEQRTLIAGVRTEIANLDTLDTRLSTQIADLRAAAGVPRSRGWMVGAVIATATLTVVILRFLGN